MTIQSGSILSLFSTFTFALIVTACAGGQSSSVPVQSSSQDLDSLRVAIQQTIGEAAEAPASCRLITFGAKPCGGPWQYLPYSTEATDSVRLAKLVDEYNSAEAELNRDQGRISDCSVVQRPDLVLEEGQCSAGP